MTEPIEFDIVIVGAGLVGASLACAIASSEHCGELRIALVEPGPPPSLYGDQGHGGGEHDGEDFDPRVVALTPQSQDFLASLGVWPAIQKQRLCPYTRMYVWDGEGTAAIEFNSRDIRQDNLGHIVENSVVLSALLDRLAAFPRVHLMRGRKVEQINERVGDQPRTRLVLDNGDHLEASLILAADGANSKVRQLLAMKTREWDYGQDAIVATVRSEQAHDFTAWQRFTRHGPLAFLPLCGAGDDTSSGDYCSIVWSVDRQLSPDLMALDDEQFAAALGSAFEHRLGKITRVSRRFSFPLRQRYALSYVRPGVALVGDAAHTIHPLAGQGVNLGLLDAQVLASEIQRAMLRGVPLGDYSLLRRYSRRRKGANMAMMVVMEAFKRLFGSQNPGLHLLRNIGMRQVDSLPALKKLLAREMGKSSY